MKKLAPATQCVHAGTIVDSERGASVSPIFPATAYPYLEEEQRAYPRYFNTPNQRAVAQKMAALEGGEEALVFSSGLAAVMTSMLAFVKTGDHVVLQSDLYGGTRHAVARELTRYGIAFDFVDSLQPEDFKKALRPNSKLLYLESPSNPLLKLIDIEAMAQMARRAGVVSMIDNTFASPINQNPLQMGIDLVLHSGTKYLAGHSDLLCGVAVGSAEHMETVKATGINLGANLGASDCALLERSLKTLALRVERQNENALAIAGFLSNHPAVAAVYYPGLASHPGHELARRQMRGFGGMLSFEVKGDAAAMVKRLKLIPAVISLGGVETTITSPSLTSHAKMTATEREQAGISDQLLRLSTGIEELSDLQDDLAQALA